MIIYHWSKSLHFVPYVCLVDVKLLGYLNYLLKFKLATWKSGDNIIEY